jgi:CheY-like chemotaxis protein
MELHPPRQAFSLTGTYMNILIVEDNSGVRRLLQRALAEVATNVWECSDGLYALAAYREHQPDIVLMDIRMPQIDGLMATRQIMEASPPARIVIVTDYDDDALRNAAREAGARAYVLKQNLTDLAQLAVSIACETPQTH